MTNLGGVRLPLGMLPLRTADAPKATTLSDRTIYEFPVIGAVALADPRPWAPIYLQRAGRAIRISKPVSSITEAPVKGELSDQVVDIRCTMFRIETDLYPESATLQPLEVYQVIHELIHLLRTVARQYWIGFAMANEGSLVQGTRSRIESGMASFARQGSFAIPFIVSPLDEQTWQFLGQLLAVPAFPSTAEVMLCDALLEIRRGDILQAVLLLGVACEVAIAGFLGELISKKGLSSTKQSKILSKPFKEKLTTETVSLGTSSPETAAMPGFPKTWASAVCALYRLRNQAAHDGACTIDDNGTQRPIGLRDLPDYLFSVEALLSWIDQERTHLGIPRLVTATMLPMGYPVSAIIVPGP